MWDSRPRLSTQMMLPALHFHGSRAQYHMKIPQDKIAAFCKKHHILKLSLFGSVLRPEFRSDSDIDVLVEFEPGHVPGLAFFAMADELSEILGRKVDPNTPQCLSRYFRDKVLQEAVVQYVERMTWSVCDICWIAPWRRLN